MWNKGFDRNSVTTYTLFSCPENGVISCLFLFFPVHSWNRNTAVPLHQVIRQKTDIYKQNFEGKNAIIQIRIFSEQKFLSQPISHRDAQRVTEAIRAYLSENGGKYHLTPLLLLPDGGSDIYELPKEDMKAVTITRSQHFNSQTSLAYMLA